MPVNFAPIVSYWIWQRRLIVVFIFVTSQKDVTRKQLLELLSSTDFGKIERIIGMNPMSSPGEWSDHWKLCIQPLLEVKFHPLLADFFLEQKGRVDAIFAPKLSTTYQLEYLYDTMLHRSKSENVRLILGVNSIKNILISQDFTNRLDALLVLISCDCSDFLVCSQCTASSPARE